MSRLVIAVAILVGVVGGGVVGYQIAARQFADLQSEREKQLRSELSMMLSMLADIADHRKNGESEIADWKFEEAHGNLDSYIRDGGPDPTQFVPDIVEMTEIPDLDE